MSLTDEQHEIRRTGLTAGDMRALVGKDPYGRTAHDVWCHKMRLDTAVVETEGMSLGNECEPMVVRRTAEKHGLWVLRRDPKLLTMRHPEFAHHIATPDGLLAETRIHDPIALAEAKVPGNHSWYEWGEEDDQIPNWALIQVTWQMHVSRIPVCYVGALIPPEVRTYRIELNPELEGVLVEACDQFHRDHIVTSRPPEVDGSAGAARMLKAMYPRQRDGLELKAGPALEQHARAFFDADRAIEQAKAEQELAKQKLLTLVGDAGTVWGDGWRLFYDERTVGEYVVKSKTYRHFDLKPVKNVTKSMANRQKKKEKAA